MQVVFQDALLSTLREPQFQTADGACKSLINQIREANWQNPADVKALYGSASLIGGKRWVFNIRGNHFRLVIDLDFKLNTAFYIGLYTHSEYDKLDILRL
jgi:mRNA interferase HigB